MGRCTYVLAKDTVCDDKERKITVYGVDCIKDGKIIKSVSDIFTDEMQAKDFTDLCNSAELSEVHFKDAIDDVLLT